MDQKISKQVVALFGNSVSVQFGNNNILLRDKTPPPENVELSRIDPVQIKISEDHVSVINMLDFTEHHLDSVDHLIGQLVHENEICSFIFVVRLGQLKDADKMGLEWLQRVFGDGVFQFVMILFIYEREEECETVIDDLKKNSVMEQMLNKCGGRYHTCSKSMNNRSEMRELMEKIECLFNENEEQCYTEDMYNTRLREREEQKKSKQKSDTQQVHEDCIKNSPTTERNEVYRGTAKSYAKKEEGPDTYTEKERFLREETEPLLNRLHLKGRHQYKMKASDVLQISSHSLQSHESCAEEELVKNYLQKLLMMNYRARYIKTNETNEQHHTQETDNESSENERDVFKEIFFFNKVTSKPDSIHPMDVQMAVFHCSDSFLKQMMVTKLSQCQFALPLLVPHPF